MLSKDLLEELYNEHKLSMAEIAERLGCSQNKVAYWMVKHGLQRRDVSEAIYQWHHPDGNPFDIHLPETDDERELFYLAVGLYVGEGKKRGHDVSLANTDAQVIRVFLRFLREICRVEESQLWGWINMFDDRNLEKAQRYWEDVTGLPRSQFYEPTVRPARGGSYLNISEFGTVTVGINNTVLRDIVLGWCRNHLNKFD